MEYERRCFCFLIPYSVVAYIYSKEKEEKPIMVRSKTY